MSGRVGSITTDIIADGLIFNMDAANRASTEPISTVTTSFNTINLTESGSFSDNGIFDSSTITPSYAFGGTDDHISLNTTLLSGLSSYTISSWASFSNFTTNNPIASNWYSGVTNYILRSIQGGSGIRLWSSTVGNVAKSTTYSITLSTDTWYNIVGLYDGSAISLYLNGVQVGTPTATSGVVLSNTNKGSIGKTPGDAYYAGNISNIQFYNRALSANEVLHNYNALKGRFGL